MSDMQRQLLFNDPSQARCPISTATRHSRIGVFRHRLDGSEHTLASAPVQDAHVLIVQMKDHPAHDLWSDGRHSPVPSVTLGTLGVLDLRRETQALLTAEVDSLHIHLPRVALDDLAADAGAPPVTELTTGSAWTPDDPVAQQLSTLLGPAVDDPHHVSQAYLDHVVLALVSHIAATYGAMRPRVIRPGHLAPWQLKRAKEMLASELASSVSLQQVADACGLSVSYFSRAFSVRTHNGGALDHGVIHGSCRRSPWISFG